MKKVYNIRILVLMLISSPILSQDVRGVYFRGSLSLPSQWTSNYTMSVTLITDASKDINRSSLKVSLGPGSGNAILPLANTVALNSINLETYSCTLNSTGGFGRIIFTDTFWVAGLRNFSVPNKSKITVMTDLGFASPEIDSGPEVRNLPISLSNFTVTGNQVTYNPMCVDADGDSLSYELGPLSGTSYHIPSGATINPNTGLFSFSKDSTDIGLYAFSIRINEWRKDNGIPSLLGLTNLAFVLTTNLTLGVNELNDQLHSLRLFPNPTKDVLNFKPGILNENEKVKLEINNTLGENVILENNFDLSQNLDVSSLTQGVYSINITDSKKTTSTKFVKITN